jgi:hypothetical protein
VGGSSLKCRHVKTALILNLTICVTIHQAIKVGQSVCLVLIIRNAIMTELTNETDSCGYVLSFFLRGINTRISRYKKKKNFVSTSVFVDVPSLAATE